MTNYYSLGVSEVFKELKSSENGLTNEEVKNRLKEYGPNELEKEKGETKFNIFLSQFRNPLILLLIFATDLSLILGEDIEAFAIFTIVILNAVLGFVQEYKAEKAIEALKKISAPEAMVRRDGTDTKIPAKDIVPGDIILLEEGDIVAADARIVEVASLKIDESALTGESVSSEKIATKLKSGISVSDQENMAFMGTVVTYGKGVCVVTATDMKTEFGKIASSIQQTKVVKTPLQKKFEQLAKQIGIIVLLLIVVVFVAGSIQGTLSFGSMVLFALVLTVSTIPNSLPIIVTVSLSMGAKRLAKKNMLIKKLSAAESLGAATIICSDKTGTITKNEMTITDIFFNNQIIKVTGTGYNPEGKFYLDHEKINPKKIELLLKIGYLCNNSKLVKKEGKFKIVGDHTEGSLIVLGNKGNLKEDYFEQNFKLIEELPFDADRKRMSVVLEDKSSKKTEAYVKGAPDLLLKKCSMIIENGKIRKITDKDKKRIIDTNNEFAENALRVLGLAYKEVDSSKKYDLGNVEKDLIFVGLVGMIDPPREEVKNSIRQCHNAGIDIMIITGDHAITSKAIAKKIGLFEEGDIILTGDEVEDMSDFELEDKIDNVRIIARALPIQKSRIVDILKKKGHIVAMTGDGVNDAPALKKADIGIAMGIGGTDVSKEVSKSILVDDNFATIVNAIAEGRNIYDKMIKSAKYLLSCNAGEITAVFMAIMLRFPLPILPLQLLLMNLLTDDFPALGLGFESSEEGIMDGNPRNPKEKPITRKMFFSIVIFGLIMGLGTLYMFMQYKDINLGKAQTVAFTTLVMFQMFAVMSSRTLHFSFKKLNPFSNMWLLGAVGLSVLIQIAVVYIGPLQTIFGTVALSLLDWGKIVGISFMGFILMEISKLFSGIEKRTKYNPKAVVFE